VTTGNAWFAYENLGGSTYGYTSFNTFQVTNATEDSTPTVGTINNYDYSRAVIYYNGVYYGAPGTVDSYGDFTICNCYQ